MTYFLIAVRTDVNANGTNLGVLPVAEVARRLSEYYAVEYGQTLSEKALQDALEHVSETF